MIVDPKAVTVPVAGSRVRDKILLVESDRGVCEALRCYLEPRGFEIAIAGSCAMADQFCRMERPELAIVDYSLPDGDALRLIPTLKGVDRTIPVIVLTGYGSIDRALGTLRLGAEQVLTKPIEMSTLLIMIQRSIENQRNRRTLLAERMRVSRPDLDPLLGESATVRKFADQAQKAVASASPILIQGEVGTGRGALARWLHRNGSRSSEPFFDVNCSLTNGELLEARLFGGYHEHVHGSSGQVEPGLLELAHKGTVFLDEIGDLDARTQSKLIRISKNKRFRRMGDTRDRPLDVHLIAATHPVVDREKSQSRDLQFRIHAFVLSVPALRERVEDIPMLSNQILSALTTDLGIDSVKLTRSAQRYLQSYRWPGNIRELRAVLERAALLSRHRILTEQDLHLDVLDEHSEGEGRFRTLEEVERQYIRHVLGKEGGHVESAARKLGVPRSSLYHKLKQYGFDRATWRAIV
jgi:DNA-binding NtrC family response regulator